MDIDARLRVLTKRTHGNTVQAIFELSGERWSVLLLGGISNRFGTIGKGSGSTSDEALRAALDEAEGE